MKTMKELETELATIKANIKKLENEMKERETNKKLIKYSKLESVEIDIKFLYDLWHFNETTQFYITIDSPFLYFQDEVTSEDITIDEGVFIDTSWIKIKENFPKKITLKVTQQENYFSVNIDIFMENIFINLKGSV